MLAYVTRRLIWTVILMVLVSGITFLIFNVIPSADPVALRAGRSPSEETKKLIAEQLGLDKPVLVQYWDYLKNVSHLDLGFSFKNDLPVREQLTMRLGPSAFLAIGGVVVWFTTAVVVGVISAVFRGRVWDRIAMGLALVAISCPVYFLGLVVLYLFADDIGKFPLLPGRGAYEDADGFFAQAKTLIMPWCVLATVFAAVYARLLRSGMVETLSEDYIRTARAKGLSERRIVFKHALRGAITPLVTLLGIDVGVLFGGAILTESVFGIPGIGRYAFTAIERNDLTTIQGTVLLLAFGVAIMTLIVDLLYAVLDPRVKLQ